jgi:hypothetical protein
MNELVQVAEVGVTQPDAFNGLSKTWFKDTTGRSAHIFHKPENIPVLGDQMEGAYSTDKRGELKFKKASSWTPPPTPHVVTPTPASTTPPMPTTIPTKTPTSTPLPPPVVPPQVNGQFPAREFKADPKKMEQDFTLEKARNMSIQRQVATKCATDLIVAGKVAYTGFHEAYTAIMEVLSNPNWRDYQPDKIVDDQLASLMADGQDDLTAMNRDLDDFFADRDNV